MIVAQRNCDIFLNKYHYSFAIGNDTKAMTTKYYGKSFNETFERNLSDDIEKNRLKVIYENSTIEVGTFLVP